ncbi:MAG: DNA/RNA nuclease SfsA [Polyangiaceae bacterium]|nr:DNA/RNA nuclease SfsA [Polyangiaceae bacterium]
MKFPPLQRGRLLRRYKRFLADILLEDGREVTAHCGNPGSMKGLLEPAPTVWLSPASSGKLAYRWQLAQLRDGSDTFVYVQPAGANQLILEALESKRIPDLPAYEVIESEVPYGPNTRFDFRLTGPGGMTWVEVKNATLSLGAGRVAFPDSVTKRGTKHLRELTEIVRSGARAALIFCASRSDAQSVEAAALIDPDYAAALRDARENGVAVMAMATEISPQEVVATKLLPMRWPGED